MSLPIRLALLAGAVFAIVSCETPAILEPKTGPGTQYPCGVDGVECANGMCCGPGETCGGPFPSVGCPADMCCYVGPGYESLDAPHKRMHSQSRPVQ